MIVNKYILFILIVVILATQSTNVPNDSTNSNQVATLDTAIKQEPVATPTIRIEEVKTKIEPAIEQPIEIQEHPTIQEQTPPITKAYSNNQQLMADAGILEGDFEYVEYIIFKESTWNYKAVNASSGATGLCQSLPASKMSSAGADYLTNPLTQMKWCHNYAQQRYGSWYNAYNFWLNNHWW